MPKSSSPEAEQKKLWRLEIRDHEKARRKVSQDFNAEHARLRKEAETANKKLSQFIAKRAKQEPKALADIDRRLGILNGRIHA